MKPFPTLRNFNRKKFSKFNFKQLQIEFNTNPDIFFYEILLNEGKVETFENIKKKKMIDFVEKKNNKEINFYSCYLQMTKDFVWNEFKLPYIYFKMLYFKARTLRKKIFQYAFEKKIRINDILESYNPKEHLTKLNEHNWEIPIEISYKRYFEKIYKVTKVKKEDNSNMYKYFDKRNLLILSRTNIKKKKLIYSGNLCDIYLQNPDTREKKKLSEEMRNEHIIKMKDIISQRKKRIKIKLRKNNNLNNNNNHNNISLLSKTINSRKGLFSLKKKVLHIHSDLPSVNNSHYKKDFSSSFFTNVKKTPNKKISFKQVLTQDSRLNSFVLSKEDFFYG